MKADKIIITNLSALNEKYGKKFKRIEAAINRYTKNQGT